MHPDPNTNNSTAEDAEARRAEHQADVLTRARAHDAGALAELCAAYYPRILKFMRYRVGPGEADDLAGEVFVKVMRAIANQTGSFDAWLYRLARNVIVDRVRHDQARPSVELDDHTAATVTNGKDHHAAALTHLDIEGALAAVSDEHRDFLTLKFVQGLGNDEISAITGQNLNAIRAMQFRALKAMRAVLDRTGAGP